VFGGCQLPPRYQLMSVSRSSGRGCAAQGSCTAAAALGAGLTGGAAGMLGRESGALWQHERQLRTLPELTRQSWTRRLWRCHVPLRGQGTV
jgi:hypothetical protein